MKIDTYRKKNKTSDDKINTEKPRTETINYGLSVTEEYQKCNATLTLFILGKNYPEININNGHGRLNATIVNNLIRELVNGP